MCHSHSVGRSLGQARGRKRYRQSFPEFPFREAPRTLGIFVATSPGGFDASPEENRLFLTSAPGLDSLPRIDSGHKTVARISRIGGRFDTEDFSGKSKGHLSQRETLEHKSGLTEKPTGRKIDSGSKLANSACVKPPVKNVLGSAPPNLVGVPEGANDSGRD